MTRTPARLLAVLVSGLLSASLLTATAPPAMAEDDRGPGAAVAALERVEAILRGDGPRTARAPHTAGGHGGRGDLTLALRDLAGTKHELRGAQRRTAERILARPTTGGSGPVIEPKYGAQEPQSTCSAVACVNWVSSGPHEATSEYAEKVLAAVTQSHQVARDYGFRSPLPDDGGGGNDKPDIYLGDLDSGYFGYATTEGYYPAGGWRAQYGYLVLDNDYRGQCSAYYRNCDKSLRHSLMRVTAAHEYFHLIQFGYDYWEDGWFMEATATWIEDEVFDGVNDNLNFLYSAPTALQTPWVPLDAPRAVPYGNWIYFRHLSEKFGHDAVRTAWEQADAWRGAAGTRNPPNTYSVRAIRRAVRQSGGAWNRDFARFAAGNRHVRRHYDEGHSYPNAPRASVATLHRGHRRALREFRLSRLASATHQIRPGKSLGRGWRLRVVVEGNTARRGGFAIATIRRRNGTHDRVTFPLGRNGRAVRKLPFGRADVRWVEITVVNASTRNKCWLGKANTTCEGRSRDNNRPQVVFVKAVR